MDSSKQFKIAIIGLGHAAKYQLQALTLTKGLTLAAACDLDQSKKENMGEILNNTPFFLDYQEMLKTVELDAVLVSTPYFNHYELAKKILREKKNLLLEKPATSTLEELEDLRSIAKTENVVFSIALHAAYGKEILWFIDNYKQSLSQRFGAITGFKCGFYDPYLIDGEVLPNAFSLGSSWLDSGINALSVIGKLVKNLKIIEARFTYVPQLVVSDIQAAVDYSFSVGNDNQAGRGCIETNWSLGLNKKITNLYFANTGTEIILNHSTQQVLMVDSWGHTEIMVDFSAGKTRLINHYLGVLEAYYHNLKYSFDNLDYAVPLHRLMYNAYSQK
ncbi:MAG: Gfo/Idh/MocA family oxidoreductase [Bacteroidota bacterium]